MASIQGYRHGFAIRLSRTRSSGTEATKSSAQSSTALTRGQRKCSSQAHRPPQDYALFEHAILHGSEQAWSEIVDIYLPWARNRILARRIGFINNDILDALAHDSLCRFWRSFTPRQFSQSRSLAQVLVYLDKCIQSSIVNWLRSPEKFWEPLEEESALIPSNVARAITSNEADTSDPLEVVGTREHEAERTAIRQHLWKHCNSADERHVLQAWLIEGKTLKQIFESDPHRWGGEPRRLYQAWRNYQERTFEAKTRSTLCEWLRNC
jgi:hypothetical protein